MIYEAEIEQTTMGRIFIKADNLEQAKQVAERYVQDKQNLSSIYLDEIWDYDIWDVSEAGDVVDGAEIINAEDML